jgi:hypothetical protein
MQQLLAVLKNIMKKILLYISVYILISLFIQGILHSVYAQTTNENSKKFDAITELLKEAEKKNNKFLAHDMYLKIYEEVNKNPEKNALKKSASTLGMDPKDVQNIVKNGDLSTLTNGKKDTELETIVIRYFAVLKEYNKELSIENLRSDLESTIKPREIFIDGDTSNSDFDLIKDLSIIEEILFNEDSGTNGYSGIFEMPKFNFEDPEEKEKFNELLRGQGETPSTSPSETKIGPKYEEGEINPLACFETDTESDLKKSLKKFENEQNQQKNTKNGQNNGESKQAIKDNEFPKAEKEEDVFKYLCPDAAHLCINIDFVLKEAGLAGRKPDDTCIECSIIAINKALDKLLKKPLSTNKLTGNILEMPKCKKINLPVNMQIVTVAVPVPQSHNHIQADIGKAWQRFNELYKPIWYKKKEDAPEENTNLADRQTKKAVMNASEDASLEEIQKRIEEQSKITTAEKKEEQNRAEQEAVSEKQGRYYQQIMQELNTMNLYFDTMKSTFEKMKAPCNELSKKAKCS